MKKYIAKIAWLLALVLLISGIPQNAITVAAETNGASSVFTTGATGTASEITDMGLSVGQGLIDTYLAKGDTIASRDAEGWTQNVAEWSYGMPKSSWKWWTGNASNTSAVVSTGDTITATAFTEDNVILLPTLISENSEAFINYKFEATFTVGDSTDGSTLNGSFGLVTNIKPNYDESIGGTRFVAYTKGHNQGTKNNRLYYMNKVPSSSGVTDREQHNVNNLAGYTAPGTGESVTLTVYTYEGTSYYYANGIYVASFASEIASVGNSLLGLFVSGNSNATEALNVTITNISVHELITTPEIPSEISALSLTVGDELIDTDVYTRYTIPSRDADGWTQNAAEWSYGLPKSDWSWWPGKAENTAAVVSANNEISVVAKETDNVILLPTLVAEKSEAFVNYKFEATFTVGGSTDGSAMNGSVGLITNIKPDYAESAGGTRFVAYAKGHKQGTNNNRLYYQNKVPKSAGVTDRDQHNVNNLTGYTAPDTGESVTLTVYTYEGTSYYYANGIYVASFASEIASAGNGLLGLFVSGNSDATVAITDISVKELLLVEDDSTDDDTTGDDTTGDETEDDDTGMEEEIKGLEFEGYYTLGEVLYQTDFEDAAVGTLPEGWVKGCKADGSTSYGWADTSGTSLTGEVVTLEGYGNVVHFGSTRTDAYLTTPATGTMDYLFEATVIVNYDTEGEFGLANNFYASATEADGCMYNSSHIPAAGAEKMASTWKYRKSNGSTKGEWAVSYYPKKGDIANLKILSYNGYNYMYWNDYLCAIAQARGVTDGSTAVSDNPGFFTFGGDIYITDVKVTKIHYDQAELAIDGATLCVDEAGNVGVDVALSFDKTQEIYAKYITGDYAYSETADLKFGVLTAIGSGQTAQEITVDTAGVENTIFTAFTQDESKLGFVYSISDIPEENYDKFYTVQPYVLVQDAYYYGTAKAYSAAALASGIYAFVEDDAVKETLEEVFADSKVFVGKDGKSLTFTLFSDFHYKAKMYPTTITDLKGILERADASNSAFVMSAGDFCNDALGSPELFNTYYNYTTQEGSLLKAYNIYGNHELESKNNSMEVVTALLTNDDSVVWGTEDGSYDYNVGYYYFESNGFRIVCTDNNYSWNPAGYWEHNKTKSYGPPSGNTNTYSLGPEQLTWLENVLTDAADKDIPCIIVEHSTSKDVSAIYTKVNNINPGTVLMCISGHTHTDEQSLNDGVFHLVCNTTRNGLWMDGGGSHYTSEHTFQFEEYDEGGNLISTSEMSLGDLSQGDNTWFFTDPLSAVISINENGLITIDGYESTWAYNIVPIGANNVIAPRISSGTYWACDILGHSLAYKYDDTYHWSEECANTLCKEVIPQTAHSYDKQVEDDAYLVSGANCGSGALYYYSCECGKAGTENFTVGEAVGEHTYGEWSIVKEATTTETGLKQKVCTVCGDVQEEVIPVVTAPSDDEEENDAGTSEDDMGTDNGDTGTSEGKDGTDDDVDTDDDADSNDNDDDAAPSKTVNTQVNSADAPDTGDNSKLGLWIALAFAGIFAFVMLLVLRKKA